MDIVRAKQAIRIRIKAGKLTDEQVKAFSVYRGLHTKGMNEIQKRQLFDILKATNE